MLNKKINMIDKNNSIGSILETKPKSTEKVGMLRCFVMHMWSHPPFGTLFQYFGISRFLRCLTNLPLIQQPPIIALHITAAVTTTTAKDRLKYIYDV